MLQVSLQYQGTGGRAGRWWGLGAQKQKNTLEGRLDVYWPCKWLNFSCRKGGPLMQQIYNSCKQLLYKCWIMKNPVLGKKQSTVHNHSPCVYKHARSHMTNTLLTVQASELAYMSLYIIYLYLVKNKLHNSTNLENCFFKIKMT